MRGQTLSCRLRPSRLSVGAFEVMIVRMIKMVRVIVMMLLGFFPYILKSKG